MGRIFLDSKKGYSSTYNGIQECVYLINLPSPYDKFLGLVDNTNEKDPPQSHLIFF